MFVLICVYVHLDNKHMKRLNVIWHYGKSSKNEVLLQPIGLAKIKETGLEVLNPYTLLEELFHAIVMLVNTLTDFQRVTHRITM